MVSQNKVNPSLIVSSTKTSLKSSPFPTPKKQPNTPQVDLSSKLVSNSKLTSDKCKKHLENNLYLYCGVGDHKLDSCPKKQTTVTSKGCSASATTDTPAVASKKLSGLHTDWGLCWTSLCSNEFYLTQHIHSFQSSFTFCFPYFFLDPWSKSP